MIAIIFEVIPKEGRKQDYLDIAAEMRPMVHEIEGFLGVERFQSLTNPDKLLSISFFEDEDAVTRWRQLAAHRGAQSKGRAGLFDDYRIRVAHVLRDYTLTDRAEAPADSVALHG
jgi:heme-degrading monooxygenase HmoA